MGFSMNEDKIENIDNWNDLLIMFLEINVPLTRAESDILVLATFNLPEHSSLPDLIAYVTDKGLSENLLLKLFEYFKSLEADAVRIAEDSKQVEYLEGKGDMIKYALVKNLGNPTCGQVI